FAEMATLVLGGSLIEFKNYRKRSTESKHTEEAYFKNPRAVQEFLTSLTMLECPSGNGEAEMRQAVPAILKMLHKMPDDRPSADELWSSFQDLNPHPCPDCDPREATAWSFKGKPLSDHDIERFHFWDDISIKSDISEKAEKETSTLSQEEPSSLGSASS